MYRNTGDGMVLKFPREDTPENPMDYPIEMIRTLYL